MGNITDYASSAQGSPTEGITPVQSLESRYDELAAIREMFLMRARECAKLTIPSLMPPAGHTQTQELYKPWQSVGARGVNNLAAKIIMALLPPGTPFFRFDISQSIIDKLKSTPADPGQGPDGKSMKDELDEGLSKYEKELMLEVESGSTRTSAFEAILHLIVCGNVTTFLPKEGGMKVFHLDSFVCVRDAMGSLLELITEERLSKQTLPDTIRDQIAKQTADKNQKVFKLHTIVRLEGSKWVTYQEVKGIKVPGSDGTYPKDQCPYIVLRWTKIDGEDYGRGHCEGLFGDLQSLEGLTRAIVQGSAAAAKALFFVNPNGVTKLKTVAEAPNGAVRTGNAADVSVLQMQKYNDFRVALETRTQLKGDLEASFLMASSVQRNAERVTAEEIRVLVGELEDALGGVYALLAVEFQLPLVNRLIFQMVKAKKLKPLPKGVVRPTIITGLDALSRSHDLQDLDLFVSGASQQLGPQVVAQYLNVSGYLTRRATALRIDQNGLIRSDADVQAQQQQVQQQQMMNQIAPHATKAIGDIAKESLKNGNPAQGSPAAG